MERAISTLFPPSRLFQEASDTGSRTSHWAVTSELSRLGAREIDAYLEDPPTKKTKSLLEAYRIAKDPKEWEENIQREIREQAEEKANADEDELEDEAAEGETKTKKRKRPSVAKEPAEKKRTGKAAFKKVSHLSSPTVVVIRLTCILRLSRRRRHPNRLPTSFRRTKSLSRRLPSPKSPSFPVRSGVCRRVASVIISSWSRRVRSE
jgi:hypothetical protein